MRWVTYRDGNRDENVGLVVGGSIHGVRVEGGLISLLGDDGTAMAEAEARARNEPTETIPFADADLAAPLRPVQVRDFLTFLDHLRNSLSAAELTMAPEFDEIPAFYFSNTSSVLGPNDDVLISPGCSQFDFELEVAAIIGRPGSDIAPEDAHHHIAGYTIFCDWSARDVATKELRLGLGPAKGKDGGNTFGPMLVTSDELEPFRSGNSFHLEMRAFVNNELTGSGWMDQMDWSWADLVAYASRGTNLRAGEALGSGTVPTGCLFELMATGGPDSFRGWLQPGDVVRLEIDQLGAIEQTVGAARPFHPLRTGF